VTCRIVLGYREKFRSLLSRVEPRRLEFGVELLLGRARERSRRDGVPLLQALADLYEFTRVRVERRVALTAACRVAPALQAPEGPPRFACDAHFGALARWLRAAGYEASWRAGIADDELVRQAQDDAATLVTGDVGILHRRAVRSGRVRAVWLPSTLPPVTQFAMLARELGLTRREPRCMACGGRLQPVAKQDVRDRIPPRTARWKDDYFLCSGCGKLFWQGTHWERIAARLTAAVPA